MSRIAHFRPMPPCTVCLEGSDFVRSISSECVGGLDHDLLFTEKIRMRKRIRNFDRKLEQ